MILLKMSFLSGVFIVAIAIIRLIMLYRLPRKTFLVLWNVVLCRLLIPLFIPSRFSVYTMVDTIRRKLFQADNLFASDIVLGINTAANTVTDITSNTVLADMASFSIRPVAAIWLVGFIVCTLFFLTTHFRYVREYKTALPIVNEWVERWKQEHQMMRKVEIRQSDKINAALTYGLMKPVVLLPKTTDWTEETKLRYILTHEYTHIKRFDILFKYLLSAAVCLHWFNPLVWVMYVLANRDIELTCDESVILAFGEAIRSTYALTLIELEEMKSSFAPFVNSFSKSFIEERMVSIMKTKKVNILSMLSAIILVSSALILFATDCVPMSADSVDTAMQESSLAEVTVAGNEMEISTENDSVSFFKATGTLNLENGAVPEHDVPNGYFMIYKDEENNRPWNQGETISLEVCIDDVLEDGQTAVIGYVTDGACTKTEVFRGKIIDNKTIKFIVPETGEHSFYVIGASSDTIHVKSLTVE